MIILLQLISANLFLEEKAGKMNVFNQILGDKVSVEEILTEAYTVFGRQHLSGEIILAFTLRKAFEKIDALEERLRAVESKQGNLPNEIED